MKTHSPTESLYSHLRALLKHSRLGLGLCLLVASTLTLHAQNNNATDTAPGVMTTPQAAPAASAPASEPAASLLTNGDFETPAENRAGPEDWPQGAGFSWETEGGKHFLRLTQQKPGTMLMAYREVAIPTEVQAVKLYIRYRTSGVVLGTSNWFDVRTIVHFLDSQRNQVAPDPKPLVLLKDAAVWTEASENIVVPPNGTTMQLMPALFQVAAGTLDLAEIRVTPLSAAEAKALTDAAADVQKKQADQSAALAKDLALPAITPEIKVSGNKLVKADGTPVWLQGVNVCSLEWSAAGDNVLWSIKTAIDGWNANCIRLPVNDDFWFGRGKSQQQGEAGQNAYREIIDNAIKLAAAKGAYIVLDLHRYQAPNDAAVEFWKDAAARYKNNPAVLFDIFNEPTGITWAVWQKGGDVEVKEKDKPTTTYHSPGMQAVVDAVRGTGANNIIIAGGLDWAYDDSGILKGYALEDKTGNGIMYSVHVYNWKTDWQHKFVDLADKYPLFLGECGADIHKMSFIPSAAQENPYTWVPNFLGLVQKYHFNWTGWSFHTSATPDLLANWNYEPTPFWGAFAKDALHGKQFTFEKMR